MLRLCYDVKKQGATVYWTQTMVEQPYRYHHHPMKSSDKTVGIPVFLRSHIMASHSSFFLSSASRQHGGRPWMLHTATATDPALSAAASAAAAAAAAATAAAATAAAHDFCFRKCACTVIVSGQQFEEVIVCVAPATCDSIFMHRVACYKLFSIVVRMLILS